MIGAGRSAGFGMEFDHLGLAVRSTERALAFLQDLGYRAGEPVYDPLQRVRLVLCSSDVMPPVEVISEADADGPLASILSGRSECIYHLCYRTADLPATLAAMKAAGHRVVEAAAPKPAVLFGGLPVSFYWVKGFGLIEIIEDGKPGEAKGV